MRIKAALKPLLSDVFLGRLDYLRSSREDRDWSGPFNGQAFRKKMFFAICNQINFSFVVETGTFRGVTTEWFASKIEQPIFSIESNKRNYGYARARLARRERQVRLFLGDSVRVLMDLFDNEVLPDKLGFFYLDAHWYRNLPIREEVSLIFSRLPGSVVMIDDFEVAGDPGYLFDDYGDAGSLTLGYLSDVMSTQKLIGFFPNCHSTLETGKRRGSIVLAKAGTAAKLREVTEILEYK